MRLVLVSVIVVLSIIANGQAKVVKEGFSYPQSRANRPEKPEFRYRGDSECEDKPELSCPNLSQPMKDYIARYQGIADRIIETAVNGSWKGKTYSNLAALVDQFPHRTSGTPMLEDSIDYMLQRMRDIGLENVHGEQVLVPHWVRGEEKAELLSPYHWNIKLLGLGTSVGTPANGIEAEVLVVTSFDDLAEKALLVPGKIVVINHPWNVTYGLTNRYRTGGATAASKLGAVATLIRSVAPFSLNTPHTGGQTYADNVTHIPTACITAEDAEILHRLQLTGNRITIRLKMLDYNLPWTTSRNVIGEITGNMFPDQVVGISGHIDSWDLGQGAMDDGGGVMISVEALALMKYLNLPEPKRTIRAILWTSEEPGLWGVKDYVQQHMAELGNWSVVFESDGGTFRPCGLDFAGSRDAGCIVQEILKLTKAINTTTYENHSPNGVSSDIQELWKYGVPGLSYRHMSDNYFWYHHTEADTMSMQDPEEMDLGTALWAIAAYVIADLDFPLPRIDQN